jgi:hypothetical protein
MASVKHVLGRLLQLVGISRPEDGVRKSTPGPNWKNQTKPEDAGRSTPGKSK